MVYAFTINSTTFPAAKIVSIGQIVNLALPLAMTGAGLIFLFITLKAAFDILRNGDNPDALKKAYGSITTAVLGLIIVVVSYLVIQILVVNLFFIVFIFSYIWFNILNWYFNVGIVTSKRVIDIDFYAVLYKEITVAQLGKIEDITVKSGGYFQSLFNYGSIFIQTAGSDVNVEFIDVPYPTDAVQIINKLLSKKHGS